MNWISKLLFTPYLGLFTRHLVLSAPGGATILQGISMLVAGDVLTGGLTVVSGIGLLAGAVASSVKEKQIAAQKMRILEETVVAVDHGDAQATPV